MNPFWLFLVVGIGLLATELLVFQFTTFWLFFIGLGALVAALYAWLVPGASYLVATIVFVLASAVITAMLYRPLRRWQNQPSDMAGNNAVGQRVVVKKPVEKGQSGVVSWSGSDWEAELANGQVETIQAGESARVISVEGIKLLVEKDTG